MKKMDQGKQKVLNYIDAFIDSSQFQWEVSVLRKTFKMPVGGFKLPKKVFNKYGNVIMPNKIKKEDVRMEFNSILRGVSDALSIDSFKTIDILKIFTLYNIKYYEIFSNDKIYPTVGDHFGKYIKYPEDMPNHTEDFLNLCRVGNIKSDLENYESLFSANKVINILKNNYKKYPVVISIHPDTSQNDLIKYIKSHWDSIAFYSYFSKDKKSKMGKTKTKNIAIKNRDEFIFKNRDKTGKEIGRLVLEKFKESLPYEYIPKIIFREKKKRQEL